MTIAGLYAKRTGIDPEVATTAFEIIREGHWKGGLANTWFAMHNLLVAYGYRPTRKPVDGGRNVEFVETTYK